MATWLDNIACPRNGTYRGTRRVSHAKFRLVLFCPVEPDLCTQPSRFLPAQNQPTHPPSSGPKRSRSTSLRSTKRSLASELSLKIKGDFYPSNWHSGGFRLQSSLCTPGAACGVSDPNSCKRATRLAENYYVHRSICHTRLFPFVQLFGSWNRSSKGEGGSSSFAPKILGSLMSVAGWTGNAAGGWR